MFEKLVLSAAYIFLGVTNVVYAASGSHVPTIDELLALKTVDRVQISPDGRWVALRANSFSHVTAVAQTNSECVISSILKSTEAVTGLKKVMEAQTLRRSTDKFSVLRIKDATSRDRIIKLFGQLCSIVEC